VDRQQDNIDFKVFISNASVSLRLSQWPMFVAMVITAVAMIIAVDTSPVAMKLHVPLEVGSTLVACKHACSKMASFDVRHQ